MTIPKTSRKIRKRSHLCSDLSCKMIWTNYSRFEFDRGSSHLCFGILKKEHVFIEKQTEHKNNVSKCEYTPLKGMIKFFTVFDDLWLEVLGTMAVMDVLQPLHCDVCNKDIKRGLTGITVTGKNPKKRCAKCYYGDYYALRVPSEKEILKK